MDPTQTTRPCGVAHSEDMPSCLGHVNLFKHLNIRKESSIHSSPTMKAETGTKKRSIRARDVVIKALFAFNKSINPHGGIISRLVASEKKDLESSRSTKIWMTTFPVSRKEGRKEGRKEFMRVKVVISSLAMHYWTFMLISDQRRSCTDVIGFGSKMSTPKSHPWIHTDRFAYNLSLADDSGDYFSLT